MSTDRTDLFNMVGEFHEKFALPKTEEGRWPEPLDDVVFEFRVSFMVEELNELQDAFQEDDVEGILDALVDLVYVALGTAHFYGFDFDEAFRRVHDANMRKVRAQSADDSKRNSSFDVVKPEGWEPAKLEDLT